MLYCDTILGFWLIINFQIDTSANQLQQFLSISGLHCLDAFYKNKSKEKAMANGLRRGNSLSKNHLATTQNVRPLLPR